MFLYVYLCGLNLHSSVIQGVAGQQLTIANVEVFSVTGHGYWSHF